MKRFLAALSIAFFMLMGASVQAQTTYFPNDAIIDHAIPYDAVIGYANGNDASQRIHGSSPTVTIVQGADITADVAAFNHSVVTITGGIIENALLGFDTSTITMTGGRVDGDLVVQEGTTVIIKGGKFADGYVTTHNGWGTIYIYGHDLKLGEYLTGTLLDGTPINRMYYGHIVLVNVPEPGQSSMLLGLCTLGSVALFRKRRRMQTRRRVQVCFAHSLHA